MDKDKIINVPTYIEKDIKKLLKLKEAEKELVLRINDYMKYNNIPKDTPFCLMKHINEDVDLDQMSIYDEEVS